jgi:hypothetical protein
MSAFCSAKQSTLSDQLTEARGATSRNNKTIPSISGTSAHKILAIKEMDQYSFYNAVTAE